MQIVKTVFLLPLFLWSLAAASGVQAADCNENGVVDFRDIDEASSADCNENRIPDECEVAPVDLALAMEVFPLERGGRVVQSGDLDGDGDLDVAVGGHGVDSAVTFFLNNGDQTFSPGDTYPVSDRLRWLELADLDGDGDLDVATVNRRVVSVLLGAGDGTFDAPVEYSLNLDARYITIADLSGDGFPDLIVPGRGTSFFSFLRNLGDGTFFRTEVPLSEDRTVIADPTALVVADFNQDGRGDLAALARGPQAYLVLLADEEGFAEPVRYPIGQVVNSGAPLQAADLTGDGFPDLVAKIQGAVTVLKNRGDGSGAFEDVVLYPSSGRAMALADLSGDGVRDILSLASIPFGLQLRFNDGAGNFGVSADLDLDVRFEDAAMTAGDYDGDADIDLALAQAEAFGVIFNSSNGRVPPAVSLTRQTVGSGINPHGIAIADYDGDGYPDVAVPDGGRATVTVFRNDGVGRLVFSHRSPAFRARFDSLSSGDVDNDGDVDLITASSPVGQVVLLRNRGAGSFTPQGFPSGERTSMAAFGDMDGDGLLDLLGANAGDASVTVVFNDDGSPFERSRTMGVGRSPAAVLAADLDGDGDNDLASANGASFDVSVLVNEGEGQFADHVSYPAPGALRFVVGGDFDHDGDIDLAAASMQGAASVFLNQGDATFGAAVDYSLGRLPYSMLTVDLDADGNLDLVSANETSSTLSLLLGRGDGTFLSPLAFAVGDGLRFAGAADLDGDGDMDLVTGNRGSDDLTVLTNGQSQAAGGESHLEKICTPLDFYCLSLPADGEVVERTLEFLTPDRDDPSLLSTLFQNARRFSQPREFLMTVFPERFGALDAAGYTALVAQRATRDYFAGSLSRLDAEGESVFVFDVVVDEGSPQEAVTLEEVRRVFDALEVAFTLRPLAYSPRSATAREVATSWEAPGFPVILIEESPSPPGNEPPLEGTPTFSLEIPEDLVICGTFATAVVGRGLQEEYELKSELRLRGGVIALPTVGETFAAELFEEVRLGPEREVAEPLSKGRFRVLGIPGPERTTIYRFNYEQEFVLADGRELEVAWVRPIQLRARGGERLDEKSVVTEEFFVVEVGSEAIQASLDGVRRVSYGSCSYETLPRFDVRVQLADGSGMRFEERFLEAGSLLATGPATLARAEVEIGGVRRVVGDYYRLVYSAERHNTKVRYRVVLDAPLRLEAGEAEDIHAIEVAFADPPQEQVEAVYLGSDFQTLRELEGTYERMRLTEEPLRFLRGDARGDGALDVTDVLEVLRYLFRREGLACAKAADANDDGRVNIVDAVQVLSQLFGGLEELAPPFPECGEDATEDELGCEVVPECG